MFINPFNMYRGISEMFCSNPFRQVFDMPFFHSNNLLFGAYEPFRMPYFLNFTDYINPFGNAGYFPAQMDTLSRGSIFNTGYYPLTEYSFMNTYTPRYIHSSPTVNIPKYTPTAIAPTISRVSKSTPVSTTKNITYKIGKFDLSYWKSLGYNHEMGKKLAIDAVQHCIHKADGGCVGYTRDTLNRIYGTHLGNAGAAYKFGTTILSNPQMKGKFKKVSMKDVERAGMPDGAIVLWKPGAPGYTKGKAALYGHGAIVYQNKAYSNCVVSNLSTCFEVWIPV